MFFLGQQNFLGYILGALIFLSANPNLKHLAPMKGHEEKMKKCVLLTKVDFTDLVVFPRFFLVTFFDLSRDEKTLKR